ncbi:MAG TPA: hypothetical protein PLN33_06710 [Hyphomonadaceae bacterium]|nr:hypothetical protein [Hyphomonadaceae bacterium]HPN07277.1 hypothetical protein [Hyphomonadaceae bacterium]
MATVVRGKASGVEKSVDATPLQNGAVIVNQLAGFRVDNRVVVYRGRDFPSLREGDEVVAAGDLKNGTLDAIALRNMTTGASYGPPLVAPMILTGVLALIGLMAIGLPLGLGYIILAAAAFVGFRIYKVSQAKAAVKT